MSVFCRGRSCIICILDMHFSGLCILSSLGPWLVAGKNVVLRLRIFLKPSSDGQVFLDFLAQEVL